MKIQLILVLFTYCQKLCLGDYKFEVLLESYANPSHRLADSTCCNYPNHYRCGRIRAVCNNLFTFCVRPYEYGSVKTSRSCPKSGARYTTSVITDDSISFRETQRLNSVTNLSNPLVFYGRVWPGQVQLYTQVYNWDVFGNQPIDDILQIWSLPVSSSYSSSRKFTSEKGRVTMMAKARVVCTNGYYGPYCSIFCGVEGCTTCPKEKECVCLPGYSGKSCEGIGKNTTQSNATPTSPDDNDDRILSDGVGGGPTVRENMTETPSPSELRQDGRGIAGSNSDGANGRGGGDSGKVAGGVIGGLLCLVLLSAIVIVCLWFGRRKIAERQAFKDSINQEYQATVESPQLVSSSYSGTYRMIDNDLYTQVPTSEDRGGWSESDDVTDLTISEAATAPSDSPTASGSVEASHPKYVNQTTSQYSLVQRRDLDVSSCHSEEEEMGEGERGEGQSASMPAASQYSVITRENMEYVSEASDSEDSHTHSDAELVVGGERENGHTSSDFNPRRDGRDRHDIRLYENIPYS